jgi:hypothetical protein
MGEDRGTEVPALPSNSLPNSVAREHRHLACVAQAGSLCFQIKGLRERVWEKGQGSAPLNFLSTILLSTLNIYFSPLSGIKVS